MTVASNQSGSQTAVISTEHTLGTTITTANVYVLVVDTANMVNGDVLELRMKTKCKSGGTERVAYFDTFANIQGTDLIKYSVAVPVDSDLTCTLKQTAGTGRVFDWNILSLQ